MKGIEILYVILSIGMAVNIVQNFEVEKGDWSFAQPFNRTLRLTRPRMEGKDVVILQSLLRRKPTLPVLPVTGFFDRHTRNVLRKYQHQNKLRNRNAGVLDVRTAIHILNNLMSDGYRDNGKIPDGAKFKIHIPVYRDRDIETTATLYANDGTVLFRFRARTRGSTGDQGQVVNQLTSNGNTPTGLSSMDLNSKEPDPKSYGPYPVLRVVKGIQGNSAIGRDNFTTVDGRDTFLSDYRSGILIHTGEWDDWAEGRTMPNSNGCIHIAPDDQKHLTDLLVNVCGCVVNKNPFGKLPYPYETQGVVSIEQLD